MHINHKESVRFLLDNGIISPAEIVNDGLQLINDIRDRFVLSQLDVGTEPRCLIKRARHPEGNTGLVREVHACRRIHSHRDIEHLAPAVLADDPSLGLFAMEIAGNGTTAYSMLSRGILAEKIGTELGRLHGFDTGHEYPLNTTETPWILSSLKAQASWMPPELESLLRDQDVMPVLGYGLEQSRRLWCTETLIHGDLKWEHCLFVPGEESGKICFIDWELASIGDPAWDIASIISEFLLEPQETPNNSGAHTFEMIRTFVNAYRDDASCAGDFFSRVALYTGARQFQTCLETTIAHGLEHIPYPTLTSAVEIFQDPRILTDRLTQ